MKPKYETVLVIEDEDTLRGVIKRNLSRRGVTVLEASSAKGAEAEIRDNQPDLLLLDINLPDKSGWDVLRDLRREGIDIPVVVVSAVRVSPARLQEFQPLAYLPKPFPIESLTRLIDPDGQRPDAGQSEPGFANMSGGR
ncbi:MAG: response regulator [Chloroflexi bacterium]|nr:response regulator [Chloroflexota bacterium]